MNKNKIPEAVYFPGLNSIRIVCCYIIVIFHINQLKGVFGYEKFNISLFFGSGHMYMTLFFVLSGFLITYFILSELYKTGSISLKNFYIRRIIRVWPLYFLIIILGFFVFPNLEIFQFPQKNLLGYEGFWEMLTAFVFFFPHLDGIIYDVNTTLGPLWSIGVEEQFYLIWPFVIGYFKKPVRILVFIIVLFLFLRYIDNLAILLSTTENESFEYLHWLSLYFTKFRLGSMAIGGLLAYAYISKHTILKTIYHPVIQWATWISLLCIQLIPKLSPKLLEHEVHSIIAGIIIINLATNPKTIVSLENKWLRSLGDFSYSSYVFHVPCILFSIYLLNNWLLVDLNSLSGNILLFCLSITITFTLSYFSFTYFESYFLRYKNRFAVIKTQTKPKK